MSSFAPGRLGREGESRSGRAGGRHRGIKIAIGLGRGLEKRIRHGRGKRREGLRSQEGQMVCFPRAEIDKAKELTQ